MRAKYFYGYNIVAAAFIIQGVCYGATFTYGIFFKELQAEFGWSRAAISGASSLCFLLGGAAGILFGRLNDKFSPRVLVLCACILSGLGYMIMSRMQALWQLYLLYGGLVSVGFGSFDVITLSTTARWFVRRRGMMSGIVKVGTGAGQLVVPLFTTALIAGLGWRSAYIILGAVYIGALAAAARVMRHDPQVLGMLPDNVRYEPSGDSTHSQEQGMALRAVIRTMPFRAMCLAEFLSFFCLLTIVVHLVPHAMDLGLSKAAAAGVISTVGGMSMLGRLFMGTVNDRMGGKRSWMVCFLVLLSALLWLQAARETWMLFLFALIYGFAHGGLFTVVSPTVAELFGTRSHGVLFGIILFSGNFGAALGPLLAGLIFDVTGSYRIVFLTLTGVTCLGFLLVTLLRPLRGAYVES